MLEELIAKLFALRSSGVLSYAQFAGWNSDTRLEGYACVIWLADETRYETYAAKTLSIAITETLGKAGL